MGECWWRCRQRRFGREGWGTLKAGGGVQTRCLVGLGSAQGASVTSWESEEGRAPRVPAFSPCHWRREEVAITLGAVCRWPGHHLPIASDRHSSPERWAGQRCGALPREPEHLPCCLETPCARPRATTLQLHLGGARGASSRARCPRNADMASTSGSSWSRGPHIGGPAHRVQSCRQEGASRSSGARTHGLDPHASGAWPGQARVCHSILDRPQPSCRVD